MAKMYDINDDIYGFITIRVSHEYLDYNNIKVEIGFVL